MDENTPHAKASNFRLSKELRPVFREFHDKEIPIETLVFFLIAVSSYAALSVLGLTYNPAKQHDGLFSKASFGVTIPMVAVGWLFVYFKVQARKNDSVNKESRQSYTHFFQNAFLLLCTVAAGLRLFAKVQYGGCASNLLREQIYCNPHAHSHGFPMDSVLSLILVPMLYSAILRDTDWSALLLSWIISNGFLIACLVPAGAVRENVFFVLYYFLLSGIHLYANQKQNIRSFMIQQQLTSVIKLNEEMTQELRANELRHMIGNVAHDLKTPLASLVTGLDMIADIAQEGLDKLGTAQRSIAGPSLPSPSHSPTVSRRLCPSAASITPLDPPGSSDVMTETKDCLEAVISTVRDNRSINNFMMMTINRCIDYTKVSKGLKLVPKFETIDLMETLSLPFKCMRDVAQKVRVNLEPLSSEICSHVITDKQWLQENILCLLSNAVKYSAGGTVNGRVRLTTAAAVGPGRKTDATIVDAGKIHADAMETSARTDRTIGAAANVKKIPAAAATGAETVARSAKVDRPTSEKTAHLWWLGSRQRVAVLASSTEEESYDTFHDRDVSSAAQSKGRKYASLLTGNVGPAPPAGSSPSVLLVEVEDTGIGLTEESMASLFNAFKQAQSLAGGTGLGLFSLARRIEALGGVYGVKKRADGVQGSLFWFTVPYRPDEQFSGLMQEHSLTLQGTAPWPGQLSLQISEKTNALEGTAIASPTSVSRVSRTPTNSRNPTNLRILIVDDSPSIQKMMSMMLRRHGHVVDQADNGAHAVLLVTQAYSELINTNAYSSAEVDESAKSFIQSLTAAYDVVLMDLQMPVMDGLEAMRRIRKAESQLLNSFSHLQIGSLAAVDVTMSRPASRRKSHMSAMGPSPASHLGTPALGDETGGIGRSLHLDRSSFDQDDELSCRQVIIGVSANSDTDTMHEALQAGADAFISKPFAVDTFYATLAKCCQSRR